jgi:hypothetical protein
MQCTGLSNVFVSATVTNIDSFAFYYCTNLQTIYFAGNAPTTGTSIFWSNEIATVYYLPDTTGWDLPSAVAPPLSGILSSIRRIPISEFAKTNSVSASSVHPPLG